MSKSPEIDEGMDRDIKSFNKGIQPKIKTLSEFTQEQDNALRNNKRDWIPSYLDKKDYEKLFNSYIKREFEIYVKRKQKEFTDLKISFGKYKKGKQKDYQFESISGVSKKTGKKQFVGRFIFFKPEEKVKPRLTAREYEEKLMIHYDKLEAKPFKIEKEGKFKGYMGYSYSGIDLKTRKRKYNIGRFYTAKKIKTDGYQWIDRRKEFQIKKFKVKK